MGRLSHIQNTGEQFQADNYQQTQPTGKEVSFNIYQVLIFQELGEDG